MFSMYSSIMHHYYHIKFLFQDIMPFTGRLQNLALTSIARLHFIISVGIKQPRLYLAYQTWHKFARVMPVTQKPGASHCSKRLFFVCFFSNIEF